MERLYKEAKIEEERFEEDCNPDTGKDPGSIY
jgi:hypothetical protein